MILLLSNFIVLGETFRVGAIWPDVLRLPPQHFALAACQRIEGVTSIGGSRYARDSWKYLQVQRGCGGSRKGDWQRGRCQGLG
jgi:hypothetical protein